MMNLTYMSCMPARLRDCRASVALWIALLAPVLTMSLGLGIEVSGWAVAKIDLQRKADVAAVAGALNYKQTSNAQVAATAADNLAQINGVAGASSPTWNSGTMTLTSNNLTVVVAQGDGIKSPADTTIQVSATQNVPLTIASPFSLLSSVTVSASSTSELVAAAPPVSASNPQVCMLALLGDSGGITTDTDLSFSGSIDLNAPNCSLRSDGDMSASGISTITADAIYTGGTLSTSGSASVTGTITQHAGQISDPYATNTTLINALTTANSATGSAISCSSSKCTGPSGSYTCGKSSCTLNPGTYTGISVTGSSTVTLNPGLYTVNGGISFAGSSSISGTGVTMVMGKGTGSGNTFSTSGSVVLQLTAPTSTTAVSGALPGVLLATQSAGGISFTGSSAVPFTGLIYAPNSNMTFSGSSTDGSTGCAEVIAFTITLSGSADLAGGCSTYGLTGFGGQSATNTAELVQ